MGAEVLDTIVLDLTLPVDAHQNARRALGADRK
jgi:hypothetical protein